MLDVVLSAVLIAAVLFLTYELYKFRTLHRNKYEIPTEHIWEKFVGIRPEDMADSDMTLKIQKLEASISALHEEHEKQKKITKMLIDELGK